MKSSHSVCNWFPPPPPPKSETGSSYREKLLNHFPLGYFSLPQMLAPSSCFSSDTRKNTGSCIFAAMRRKAARGGEWRLFCIETLQELASLLLWEGKQLLGGSILGWKNVPRGISLRPQVLNSRLQNSHSAFHHFSLVKDKVLHNWMQWSQGLIASWT